MYHFGTYKLHKEEEAPEVFFYYRIEEMWSKEVATDPNENNNDL